jgi:hypothetical protein
MNNRRQRKLHIFVGNDGEQLMREHGFEPERRGLLMMDEVPALGYILPAPDGWRLIGECRSHQIPAWAGWACDPQYFKRQQ